MNRRIVLHALASLLPMATLGGARPAFPKQRAGSRPAQGACAISSGGHFAVADEGGARLEEQAYLYRRSNS